MLKYPQSLFIREIAARISEDTEQIIDAPCGTGQTSYELATYFKKSKVVGLDVSQKNIEFAKKECQRNNLNFQQKDIHAFVEEVAFVEIFCLINSLFLLPKPIELLQKIGKKLTNSGRFFLILPNPQSTSFKRYQKIFPDVNSFVLRQKDYSDFFDNIGLQILHCKGIARVPIYGRWDTKLLYPVRDRYLFWLESRSLSEDYGYYLIELKKQN